MYNQFMGLLKGSHVVLPHADDTFSTNWKDFLHLKKKRKNSFEMKTKFEFTFDHHWNRQESHSFSKNQMKWNGND